MVDVIKEFVRSYQHDIFLQSEIHQRSITTTITILKRLETNWININIDGAVVKNKIADCEGLARNCVKEWLDGFSKNVGICNVLSV